MGVSGLSGFVCSWTIIIDSALVSFQQVFILETKHFLSVLKQLLKVFSYI